MQNLHNIPKSVPYQSSYCCVNIHICYSNHEYLHGYCKCVYYYFINVFSHLYSHQSLFPHILSTLPNHHSITTITTHDIPITKSTKSKEKSIQTQNQTFNGKLNNLESKIKLSTKNPSTQTQTQIEAAVPTTMESLLQPLERRETSAWELQQRKRSKNKKWREKTVEVERRCDFVR